MILFSCQNCGVNSNQTEMKFTLCEKEIQPGLVHVMYLCIACLLDAEKEGWTQCDPTLEEPRIIYED